MARMTIKKLRILKVSSIVGLVGIALTAHTQYAHSDSAPLTIEAQGRGDVQVKPDAAIISVSVIARGATAQDAAKRNAATDNAIVDALLAKALVNKDAIETSQSSISSFSRTSLRVSQSQWHALGGFTAQFPAAEKVLLSLMDAVTADRWAHVMDDSTKNGKSELGIQVYGEGVSAKEAAAAGNAHIEKLKNLVKAKVPEAEITEFDLRLIAPQDSSPFQHEEPEFPYTARNELLIRIESVARVPAVVDEAMAAGADGVSYVNLVLRDPPKAQTEAIYEATKQAKLKAQAEAAALGMKLGPLLKSSVPETPSGGNYREGGVGSGDVHVSADVTLTYSTR